MARKPSYAKSLAKDRDLYLRQRNNLARHLRTLIETFGGPDPERDAPIIKSASAELTKIFGRDEAE